MHGSGVWNLDHPLGPTEACCQEFIAVLAEGSTADPDAELVAGRAAGGVDVLLDHQRTTAAPTTR